MAMGVPGNFLIGLSIIMAMLMFQGIGGGKDCVPCRLFNKRWHQNMGRRTVVGL